ncbi:MAG: hypothetical protein ABIA93_07615 [Candidatus Woesearchaeota archaeon]
MLKRIKEKKERQRKIVLSIVISALMILSVFGILIGGFSSGATRLTYNGHKFEQVIEQNSVFYVTKINGQKEAFLFYPADLEAIAYTPGVASIIKGATILSLSRDAGMPASTAQYLDLLKYDLLQRGYSVQSASLGPNSYGWPQLSCEDSTSQAPVIVAYEAQEPSIQLNGNCVVLEGNGTSMLMVHDRLLYALNGVMSDG